MIKKFNEWLYEKRWCVKLNENKDLDLNYNFMERYKNINNEYKEFLLCFDEVISNDEKTWFLCQSEYNNKSSFAFKWNEFEELSLEVAEEDEEWKKDIKLWWDKKIPIVMSVRDGYSFFAIDLDDDFGRIVRGVEPEFEETEIVADSFFDFLDKLIKGEIII